MLRFGLNGSIDYGHPVSDDDPLTTNLLGWWLSLPKSSGGSLFDLTGRTVGTATNTSPAVICCGRNGRNGAYGSWLIGDANPPRSWEISGSGTSYANFSISVWYYYNGSGDSHLLRFNPDGDINLNGSNLATWTGGSFLQATGGAVSNAWSHFGLTGDGTNVRFYKNGQLLSTVADTRARGTLASIGRYYSNASWNGYLDDVCYWTRTLSDADMWEVYEDGFRGHPRMLRRIKQLFSNSPTPPAPGTFDAALAAQSSRLLGGIL